MKFSYYLCLIILSITMASCDKFFGEELTDLIFDHGKFEMPDKALFIGNSLLLGNGAFGMNATDSASDYHAIQPIPIRNYRESILRLVKTGLNR